MVFTLSGSVMLVNPPQPLNASSPMSVARVITMLLSSGKLRANVLLYTSFEYPNISLNVSVENVELPIDGSVMLLRFEQPLNALLPTLVTLSGIFMLVKLVQLENAQAPMLVTLSGIFTLVRP